MANPVPGSNSCTGRGFDSGDGNNSLSTIGFSTVVNAASVTSPSAVAGEKRHAEGNAATNSSGTKRKRLEDKIATSPAQVFVVHDNNSRGASGKSGGGGKSASRQQNGIDSYFKNSAQQQEITPPPQPKATAPPPSAVSRPAASSSLLSKLSPQVIATDVKGSPGQPRPRTDATASSHARRQREEGRGGRLSGEFVAAGDSTAALAAAQATIEQLTADLEKERQQHTGAKSLTTALQGELTRRHKAEEEASKTRRSREEGVAKTLTSLLSEMAAAKRRATRQKLAADAQILGRWISTSSRMGGPSFGQQPQWEDGQAMKDLEARTAAVAQRRKDLAERKNKASLAAATVTSSGTESLAAKLEAVQDEAALEVHIIELDKEVEELEEEKRSLESRKALFGIELRRVSHEDMSQLSKTATLGEWRGMGRFVLQSLLGRGGFSEVWKAYDLQEMQEVAVKIHQFALDWGDDRRHSYIKHATREFKIQKTLIHPRIVRLLDVFEINNNTFATVLELCDGTALDTILKQVGCLPEKRARAILLQIMCGVLYLSVPDDETGRAGVIHYDLKPANILLDKDGDVKITDFGLSKFSVGDEGAGPELTSMELTSQGAGTLHYLPPECFMNCDGGVRISTKNKIDVWSIGVIFYQMLYGRRPFGEGQTQEAILRDSTMLRATTINFPPIAPKPLGAPRGTCCDVSEEAKNFTRACLTYSQADRPDITQLAAHTYLTRNVAVANSRLSMGGR